jgi:hypothetical protein
MQQRDKISSVSEPKTKRLRILMASYYSKVAMHSALPASGRISKLRKERLAKCNKETRLAV